MRVINVRGISDMKNEALIFLSLAIMKKYIKNVDINKVSNSKISLIDNKADKIYIIYDL